MYHGKLDFLVEKYLNSPSTLCLVTSYVKSVAKNGCDLVQFFSGCTSLLVKTTQKLQRVPFNVGLIAKLLIIMNRKQTLMA